MSLSTVTLKWDLTDLIESGLSATLSITPTAQMSDTTDHILIPPVARAYAFAGGAGQLAGIVANDNASIAPAGAGYLISVTDGNGRVIVPQFQTQLLTANGATQWLDALVVVPVVATAFQYVPLQGGVALGGAIAPRDITLADAATVTPTPALANDFTLLMTSAVGSTRAIAACAPLADCQTVRFLLVQPASGGPCGVTWATGANGYDFGSAGAPTLSGTASQGDIAGFQFRTINGTGKWRYLGDQGGLS